MNGVDNIISDLERQRSAIDRALAALREIHGTPAGQTNSAARPAAKKRRMSAEGRRRIAEASRKRWAAVKAASGQQTRKKANISPEARKRMSEATRKRWAAYRKAKAQAQK